jgi:diphthine-ammonia ligase
MTPTPLYVVALISGGKDSLFSLLHCDKHGHQVVALANLYPGPRTRQDGKEDAGSTVEGEDLDSFMYQTVGHTIVPLYAEALKLPLYRGEIKGVAVNTSRDYTLTEQNDQDGMGDETEDLVPLLQQVKQSHPEVNAISTGAILSTYQRTRIESVALRLGLTPLAYLWQYPLLPPPPERGDSVTGLLDDMEAAGCDARLIKIASGGIPESVLWSRVSDPSCAIRLQDGVSRFSTGDAASLRGAILGEGGEYETLAINGPSRVWKKRIHIDPKGNQGFRDAGGAVRLTFGEAKLISQPEELTDDTGYFLPIPGLLDDRFEQMTKFISPSKGPQPAPVGTDHLTWWKCPRLDPNISQTSSSIAVNNLISTNHRADVREQTKDILSQLDDYLMTTVDVRNHLPYVVVFTTVVLRHISDFSAVNDVYTRRSTTNNPPARVSVCCGESLPRYALVCISFVLSAARPSRIKNLHVQSVSYWAPANIGPYSQAMSAPIIAEEGCHEAIVYLAGQIPLLPCSMKLIEADFLQQAVLSLQHLWRVSQSVRADWWIHAVAYLADDEFTEIQKRANTAWNIWKAAITPTGHECSDKDSEDEDTVDAWDLKYNHAYHPLPQRSDVVPNSHLHTLPNYNLLESRTSLSRINPNTIPPFLAAHVSALPRFAPIEWHGQALSCKNATIGSKRPLTVTTAVDEDFSIFTCQLKSFAEVENNREDDDDDNDEANISRHQHMPRSSATISDFFNLQIFFTPEGPSSTIPLTLATRLQTALIKLDRQLRHDPTYPALQNAQETNQAYGTLVGMTIYICSQAGYDAVNTTTLAPDTHPHSHSPPSGRNLAKAAALIPCHSLWGQGGRRVEMAILGRSETSGAVTERE